MLSRCLWYNYATVSNKVPVPYFLDGQKRCFKKIIFLSFFTQFLFVLTTQPTPTPIQKCFLFYTFFFSFHWCIFFNLLDGWWLVSRLWAQNWWLLGRWLSTRAAVCMERSVLILYYTVITYDISTGKWWVLRSRPPPPLCGTGTGLLILVAPSPAPVKKFKKVKIYNFLLCWINCFNLIQIMLLYVRIN